jgi:hypothetical protein
MNVNPINLDDNVLFHEVNKLQSEFFLRILKESTNLAFSLTNESLDVIGFIIATKTQRKPSTLNIQIRLILIRESFRGQRLSYKLISFFENYIMEHATLQTKKGIFLVDLKACHYIFKDFWVTKLDYKPASLFYDNVQLQLTKNIIVNYTDDQLLTELNIKSDIGIGTQRDEQPV